MLLLFSVDFFKINFFSKISFRNTIKVSNCLELDQDKHSVGPDLGPNCYQRKPRVAKERVKFLGKTFL